MIPNILSIAGSDPSGGAGIQADIKAISANVGYAMAAITALTAQNTRGVRAVQIVPPDIIADQIAAIRDDIRIDAVKIGMLGDVATINVVARALDGIAAPIVLDPVMVAKGGDRLLARDAVAALRDILVPKATILTPNLPEAADLLDEDEVVDPRQMRDQGARLLAMGATAVLLKGGHLAGPAIDLLIARDGVTELAAPRIDTGNTHGTGCSLSSALATLIGAGHSPQDAARGAKAFVTAAIRASGDLSVGHGHGPIHHFHARHTENLE
ncbi:bifunctional hydroxymethylpyrimidine kinase/phosphomethylpyrimidine kinase [Jannaschia donghaensis]|uniref:hydroxymethylpyrimidine kinase n=1 Tax=Jannaschia donghaensis TaxID=420998 RepID=A0A0M6YQG3_9RHOB|nr:bifunctional hydroxymethylpyrimidine kinase/phosphomethylpyrimidine kinase [Jannaschia donghaensis]CTQ51246.1 Hydroxymethylpyrimidine/phosphomethylpyrimidine kinase [Jannaschia donghaensis]